MADTKISALDAIAAIAGEDLLAAVDDPSGTPVTKKATITQLATFLWNSPTLVTPALGTPASGVLTSCTGLPLTTGVTGVLPSANMDADTAHLTTTQTFSGAKTFTLLITATAGIDINGANIDNIQKSIYDLTTITSSATIALDFNGDDLAKLALAHNTTFSTSNLAVGKTMEIHITSAAARTLAFPAGWTFYGTKPTTTTAGKDSVLQLTSIGTTDADVKAVFVEEA